VPRLTLPFPLSAPRQCPCAPSTPPPPQVELKVNKLTSPKTHLGYEHYSLAFCKVRTHRGNSPESSVFWGARGAPDIALSNPPAAASLNHVQPQAGIQGVAENLGEHLMGDTIQNSDYDVSRIPKWIGAREENDTGSSRAQYSPISRPWRRLARFPRASCTIRPRAIDRVLAARCAVFVATRLTSHSSVVLPSGPPSSPQPPSALSPFPFRSFA
jgi:hypothetical protein